MKAIKNTFKLNAVILFIGISQLLAQGDFEGKVTYNTMMYGEEENVDMDYYIKGEKVRLEMKYEGMTQVMLMKEQKLIILMPEQKMYMEFDGGMDETTETTVPEDKPVNTGEIKTILGYKCEKWMVISDDSDTEMWLAEGLGKYMFSGNPMEGSKSSWQKGMQQTGYFPLLIISRNKNGKEEYKQEATAITKMSLSDDIFSLPAGYQKMAIPSMPVMPQR